MMLRFIRYGLMLACMTGMAAALAQDPILFDSVPAAAKALGDAQAQGEAARRRAEILEANARSATAAADKSAQESAALAARIQQTEASIAANQAQIGLVERQRADLRITLAAHQQPLIRLTAALQRLSRRPPLLALLRPGSLRDTVYLRAVLQTMLPEVQRRTAGLRAEIDRGRTLQREAGEATAALRVSEADFARQRQALAALETQQRLTSREAGGVADRETERALALAEQARDLGGLVDQLAQQGTLRTELAALPGPVLRPARPATAKVVSAASPESLTGAASVAVPLPHYQLPVAGRLVAGFGAITPGKLRSRGVSVLTNPSAQAVAPAAGRIAFAGPYDGYGNIVIIEHADGWTSLITGLTILDTRVGQRVVGGSPLGLAGPGQAVITLELRRGGEAVNPLEYLRE